jgi:AcrR family transcriptional regulator
MKTIKTSVNSTRRERVRLATQSEILETARRQMVQEGVAALSLRAIAREMGVTAPALYRYYPNRDDLVTALIVEAFASLGDTLQAARDLHANDAPAERLLVLMMTYRAWALTHAQDYALIFGTPIPGYVAPEEKTLPLAKRAMDVIVAEIAAAIESGVAKPAPEYAKPSPTMQKQVNAWKKNYVYAEPTVAMHLGLIGWTRAHGMVSLELFGQTQPMLGDPTELYREEMLVFLKQVGFVSRK